MNRTPLFIVIACSLILLALLVFFYLVPICDLASPRSIAYTSTMTSYFDHCNAGLRFWDQ